MASHLCKGVSDSLPDGFYRWGRVLAAGLGTFSVAIDLVFLLDPLFPKIFLVPGPAVPRFPGQDVSAVPAGLLAQEMSVPDCRGSLFLAKRKEVFKSKEHKLTGEQISLHMCRAMGATRPFLGDISPSLQVDPSSSLHVTEPVLSPWPVLSLSTPFQAPSLGHLPSDGPCSPSREVSHFS
ncbi:hypothetical protein P7K49_012062 [Saguinus oedipus]|uniref:Uncharacterized protein n=1 Tax=Saguinus oedipus TaxID=9490 RepID=A0ABQ9VT14_SAGOE|nr:hypothetical protein P7K49_012062 [Saguinus oedipus]